MKEIINFLRLLWELPQNLLGFILFQVYSVDCQCMEAPYGDVRILYSERMRGGISLGRFIILPWKYRYNSSSYVRDTISHESVAISRLALPHRDRASVPAVGLGALHVQKASGGGLLFVLHRALGR